MYVCMYVCIYIYIYINTYIFKQTKGSTIRHTNGRMITIYVIVNHTRLIKGAESFYATVYYLIYLVNFIRLPLRGGGYTCRSDL